MHVDKFISYLVVMDPAVDGVCACACSSSLEAVCASVCTVLGAAKMWWKISCVLNMQIWELRSFKCQLNLNNQCQSGRWKCLRELYTALYCVVCTGPVCSLKPVSRAPVSGLKEFPHTGGLSIRERNELPSCVPGQSIIPAEKQKRSKRKCSAVFTGKFN